MALYAQICPSPLGELFLLGTEEALCWIGFSGDGQQGKEKLYRKFPWSNPPQETLSPLLQDVEQQLQAYFRGDLREFHIPLLLHGTEFQRRVWQAISEIPYGQTRSYGELARKIGHPAAVRAVGQACGQNPVPIVVPCHRVVQKSGRLGGYGGGIERKKQLLALEKTHCIAQPEDAV